MLKNTKITPRLNISSSVFIGASFHLSNSEELSSISVHPAVSNIWPVSVYPRPSPRIDSVINVSNSRINAERFTSRDTYTPHTMTGVNKLHNQGFNGKGVIIAIIDTGIDYR